MNKIILACVFVCLSFVASKAQDLEIRPNAVEASPVVYNRPVRTIPAADFERLLTADTTIQLVDVRTPSEYKSGHIPGAKNMDVRGADFDKAIGGLDVKRPVAVYCRSGVRSKIALEKLEGKGFRVFELDKGINAWTGKKEK